jgi:hypothetical protein
MTDWDPAETTKIDQIQEELGYFKNTRWPP